MRNLIIIISILLLAGCETSITRVDYSYHNPFLIGHYMNKGTQSEPINGHSTSIRLGNREELENFDLELTVGPTILLRDSGDGKLFTAEAVPRVIYKQFFLRPYLEAILGIGYLPHKWDGEATNLQFSVGGTLGISVPLSKNWEFDVGYRYYHVSNGSSIFGTERPNIGYNSDGIAFGFSFKF